MTKKLNGSQLKLIAIIAMTIDHLTWLCWPGYNPSWWVYCLHIIGRLTAPIMWFFIAEGAHYTHDRKKYALRILAFALVSHFAYCFAFGINYIPFSSGNIFNQTSIMWSLAWSVVALYIVNSKTNLKEWQKWLLVILINLITFSSDYSCIAVMAILSMYSNRGNLKKQFISMSFWILIYAIISYLFVSKVYGLIKGGVILVYPLLNVYNGKKGKLKWMKWFFYLYYPLHLILIGILRIIIYGNVPLLFN